MKKILLLLFVFIAVLPKLAFAHILQADGSIGAVLHIDPEDDPIVGSPANFFFEFKDKQNKFEPQLCSCTVSINEGDKEIYSQPLFASSASSSLTNASFTYTFPKKNVYKLIVKGKPLQMGAFQPFNLVYDLRVARDLSPQVSVNSANNSHVLMYVLIGLGVFFLTIFLIKYINRR